MRDSEKPPNPSGQLFLGGNVVGRWAIHILSVDIDENHESMILKEGRAQIRKKNLDP